MTEKRSQVRAGRTCWLIRGFRARPLVLRAMSMPLCRPMRMESTQAGLSKGSPSPASRQLWTPMRPIDSIR